MTVERRIVGAVVLTLLAAWEMYASPGPSLVSMGVWVVAALAIGLLLRAGASKEHNWQC